MTLTHKEAVETATHMIRSASRSLEDGSEGLTCAIKLCSAVKESFNDAVLDEVKEGLDDLTYLIDCYVEDQEN